MPIFDELARLLPRFGGSPLSPDELVAAAPAPTGNFPALPAANDPRGIAAWLKTLPKVSGPLAAAAQAPAAASVAPVPVLPRSDVAAPALSSDPFGADRIRQLAALLPRPTYTTTQAFVPAEHFGLGGGGGFSHGSEGGGGVGGHQMVALMGLLANQDEARQRLALDREKLDLAKQHTAHELATDPSQKRIQEMREQAGVIRERELGNLPEIEKGIQRQLAERAAAEEDRLAGRQPRSTIPSAPGSIRDLLSKLPPEVIEATSVPGAAPGTKESLKPIEAALTDLYNRQRANPAIVSPPNLALLQRFLEERYGTDKMKEFMKGPTTMETLGGIFRNPRSLIDPRWQFSEFPGGNEAPLFKGTVQLQPEAEARDFFRQRFSKR